MTGNMSSSTSVNISDHVPGTIYPFHGSDSIIQTVPKEFAQLMLEPKAKRIAGYIAILLLCTVLLLLWSNSTNSMALTAYTYLMIFNILSMLSCLVTIWVQKQQPSPIFSFGYERFEVLAVFASTILAQLGCLFILKESIERMVEQPEVHTGRLLVGTMLAFTSNMVVTYSMDIRAFNHVISASSSSWLQEHVSDISESICHVVPGLSKLLLPRLNPLSLISSAGAITLILVYILIDVNQYYSADTWVAAWIALMIVGTMFPMSVYSGKILLQTTPSHIIGQLDKCIREASTLDGVLEFRHEHFWTLSFATMAGSVHVRIRRDADEQLVLAHVYNRLSNLVSLLTVQIFKDDWNRPSAYQILGESSLFGSPAGPSVGKPAGASHQVKNIPLPATANPFVPANIAQMGRIGSSQVAAVGFDAMMGGMHGHSADMIPAPQGNVSHPFPQAAHSHSHSHSHGASSHQHD